MGKNGIPSNDLDWTPATANYWNNESKNGQVLIVGGTSGIGRALAKELVTLGATVTVVGRSFKDEGVTRLKFVKADLSSLREAQHMASNLPAEDFGLVVFTTGIIPAPKREETKEGIELDMAVSFLSRFVILRELALKLGKALQNTKSPRVFIMGFPGADVKGNVDDANSEQSYKVIPTHKNTVTGNEALVVDAATRYKDTLLVFGLNPGLIKTDIRAPMLGGRGSWKHGIIEGIIGRMFISAENYAARIVPLFGASQLEGRSGALFNQKGKAIRRTKGFDDELVAKWMAVSEKLVAKANAS